MKQPDESPVTGEGDGQSGLGEFLVGALSRRANTNRRPSREDTFTDYGIVVRDVVRLSWSITGLDSTAHLLTIGDDRKRHLVWEDKAGRRHPVATIEPSDDPHSVNRAVDVSIRNNGTGTGPMTLMDNLPTEVCNCEPWLLSKETLRDAFWGLMEYWDDLDGVSWALLPSSEPTQTADLDSVEQPSESEEWRLPRSWQEWEDEKRAESAALSPKERYERFDRWFERAYVLGADLTSPDRLEQP